jgi:VCBS repeat-containing protein
VRLRDRRSTPRPWFSTRASFRRQGEAWVSTGPGYEVRATEAGVRFSHGQPGAGLELGPASLARSGVPVALMAATLRDGARGALEISRGALVERYESRAEGLEQSFVLPAAPAGHGALSVRVPVTGHFSNRSPQGLHFEVGGRGYLYGHGTFVDADGQRTEVEGRYGDGAITFELAEALVENARFPAVLDPLVSAELSLDTPVLAAAGNNQPADSYAPAVAWNGTEYLLTWIDGRNGGGRDVYAARVSSTGTVLDPTGIVVYSETDAVTTIGAAAANEHPAVASDGSNFFIVWTSYDTSSNPGQVFGARVSSAGTVLDATPRLIRYVGGSTSSILPRVAYGGGVYLVTWDENDGASDQVGAITVSTAGVTQGTALLFASSTAQPDVDFDGTNFFVVYMNTLAGRIAGQRISPAGAPVGAAGYLNVSGGIAPAVAWNGSEHLVVWELYSSGSSDINGVRVAVGGTPIDGTPLVINAAAGTQKHAAVASLGTNGFAVAWSDLNTTDVSMTTVTTAGAVSTGSTLASAANSQLTPALATGASNVLALWADQRGNASGLFDVYGVLLSTAGAPQGSAVLITQAGNEQYAPAVAFDGTNYLVVWEDHRGATADIYGARVNTSGTVLDVPAFVISAAANNQMAPAVAWNGTNYLVVWQDDRTTAGTFDVYGARVSAAGSVLDASGFVVSAATGLQQHPRVASDGTNWLVAYEDTRAGGALDIYATRVSAAGAVMDASGIAVCTESHYQSRPTVAWNGSTWAVIWSDARTNWYNVEGALVSAAGVVANPNGVPLEAATSGGRMEPTVGACGGAFLIAWWESGGSTYDLYSARVTGGLSVGGKVLLGPSTTEEDQAAIGCDGTNFLVAWRSLPVVGPGYDVVAARVNATTGLAIDTTPFTISANPQNEELPAIASSGSRSYLVAYQSFSNTPAANAHRIMARRVTNTTPVGTLQSVTTPEDTSLAIVLAATDADGDALTYTVATQPAHGTLTGTAPNVNYAPAANYNGPDSFTFTVSDGLATSTAATVSITVTPVNDPPVAQAQSLTTAEDTALAITVVATDIDGPSLSYTYNQPAHGSVTGTGPSLSYLPASNYNGSDAFTFTASDGTLTSTATISINVTPVNDPPVATLQNLTTPEDQALGLTLTGTDVEGSPLTFVVTTSPLNGTLTGTAPNLVYTPALNYNGTDFISFKANDGQLDSTVATISITVVPVNDPPVAQNSSVTVSAGNQVSVALSATDVDQFETLTLTYAVVTPPQHGALTGTGQTLIYKPTAGYEGPDSFTFKATDVKNAASNVATVSITVTHTNAAPVAANQAPSTNEDTALSVTLTATDSDSTTLTYAVVTQPVHGTLTGNAPNVTYTPSLNYNGPDSFTFKANDGQSDSNVATISLTVVSINDAPTANSQSVSTPEDTQLVIILTGADVESSTLTYAVTAQPQNGTLTGTPPNLLYTPNANFFGNDTLLFKVNDGQLDSNVAQVSIVVSAVDDAPVATNVPVTVDANSTNNDITLAASDIDSPVLAFVVVTQPSHGTLSGSGANQKYTPTAGYEGADSFTFKANDGVLDSNVATVSITVSHVNHPPGGRFGLLHHARRHAAHRAVGGERPRRGRHHLPPRRHAHARPGDGRRRRRAVRARLELRRRRQLLVPGERRAARRHRPGRGEPHRDARERRASGQLAGGHHLRGPHGQHRLASQ